MADTDENQGLTKDTPIEGPVPKVRPRWVWGGLVVLLVGAILVGWGVAITSWWWSGAGVVVLLVGAGLAWRGRLLNDVHGTLSMDQAVTDVVHNVVYPGADPSDRLDDDQARETAAEVTALKHDLFDAGYETPGLAPIGSSLLIGCAGWLALAQWTFYPTTAEGQAVGLRDLGVAIVLALAAFCLRLERPEPAAWAVCVLCGVALIVLGTLANGGENTRSVASEVGTGGVVLLGCALAVRKVKAA